MTASPVSGPGYLLQGARLLARPELRPFVLIPLLVNILVLGAAIWYGILRFEVWLTELTARIPAWLEWLTWLLWPLFIGLLLVTLFYGFTLVANLLAAPFNGLLAARVETLLVGRPPDGGADDWKALLRTLPTTLLDELGKLLYALLWAIPCLLLLLFVPLAGPLIWFLYTAWILAVQYSDYPMGNHGLTFREMRRRLRRRPLLSLGFGASAAGASLIPVVNFILMPAAVAGATLMWVREFQTAPDAGPDAGTA